MAGRKPARRVLSSKSLMAQMQALDAAASDLNRSSDALSQTLKKINDRLASLQLGITGEVIFDGPDEAKDFSAIRFGPYKFRKDPAGLHLVHGSAGSDYIGDWYEEPLAEMCRDHRLVTAEHLPELIEKLTRKASALSKRISKRATDAGHLLEESETKPLPKGFVKVLSRTGHNGNGHQKKVAR